jgi:hypothetical protein
MRRASHAVFALAFVACATGTVAPQPFPDGDSGPPTGSDGGGARDGGGGDAAPTCTDGVKNGTETDIDCGGSCTTKCDAGRGCDKPEDCSTGVCTMGKCAAAACDDGVKNGTETDVDCGGNCGPCPEPFVATTDVQLMGGKYTYKSFVVQQGVTVTVTGTMPLEILVKGTAQIDGTLAANGTASVATNPNFAVGKGVAGGGDGGACGVKQGTAGANPGGGLPGKSDSNNGGWGAGGGGGSYGTAGTNGANGAGGAYGALGGAAGPVYGDAQLTQLLGGSGGGGGGAYSACTGAGTSSSAPSSPGGGGGVIKLTAMGGITIGASGKITANGGDSGSVIYAGGTGGGGSGGAIWLRGPTLSNAGTVQAIGGKAGTPGGGSAGGKGGDGGNGRIRFDFGMITALGTVTPAVGYMGAYP